MEYPHGSRILVLHILQGGRSLRRSRHAAFRYPHLRTETCRGGSDKRNASEYDTGHPRRPLRSPSHCSLVGQSSASPYAFRLLRRHRRGHRPYEGRRVYLKNPERLNIYNMINVKIQLLHPDAKIPFKTYEEDYCYDCVAVSEEEIAPNVWKYNLGFAIQNAEPLTDYFNAAFTLRPRSSIWKTGMVLSNSVGTVDEPYTGELSAIFYHVMPNMPRYRVGDKVCQLHFDSTYRLNFVPVEKLTPTARGNKGYGSTGH